MRPRNTYQTTVETYERAEIRTEGGNTRICFNLINAVVLISVVQSGV
jgi:hypothetical protein